MFCFSRTFPHRRVPNGLLFTKDLGSREDGDNHCIDDSFTPSEMWSTFVFVLFYFRAPKVTESFPSEEYVSEERFAVA